MAGEVEDISLIYVKDPGKVANCNEFIQAVAQYLGGKHPIDLVTPFAGKSQDIVAKFAKAKPDPPFVSVATKDEATKLANAGQFVVAGLTADEMRKYQPGATMGHIVVVAPGGPSKPLSEIKDPKGNIIKNKNGKPQEARGGYPYCYQGAHYGAYQFNHKTQVDVVFPSLSLPHIHYAYIDILRVSQPAARTREI
jgi:hypothetical protein